MFVIGEDHFKAHGVCHVYVESGTTRIACFLWYPVAFWGYFAVFRGGYYKKSRFCVVPAVMGVFSLCKGVDLKYIVLYLRHR